MGRWGWPRSPNMLFVPATILRPRRFMSSTSDEQDKPSYQSAAESVLDSLFAQSSSDRMKSSPLSSSRSGSAPDSDDLLGELESLIVERRINESLVLYRKIRRKYHSAFLFG